MKQDTVHEELSLSSRVVPISSHWLPFSLQWCCADLSAPERKSHVATERMAWNQGYWLSIYLHHGFTYKVLAMCLSFISSMSWKWSMLWPLIFLMTLSGLLSAIIFHMKMTQEDLWEPTNLQNLWKPRLLPSFFLFCNFCQYIWNESAVFYKLRCL